MCGCVGRGKTNDENEWEVTDVERDGFHLALKVLFPHVYHLARFLDRHGECALAFCNDVLWMPESLCCCCVVERKVSHSPASTPQKCPFVCFVFSERLAVFLLLFRVVPVAHNNTRVLFTGVFETKRMNTEMNGSDSSTGAATVVVVERDYSRGLTPQFDTKVPPELQDRIAQDEFARIVEYVNECIVDSDSVTCGSACENITAYLTCFLSLLFCKTHSQRVCSFFIPRVTPTRTCTHIHARFPLAVHSALRDWTSFLRSKTASTTTMVWSLCRRSPTGCCTLM